MKRLMAIIIAACLTAMMASCGGSTSNNTNGTQEAGETDIEYKGGQTEKPIDFAAYGLDKEFLDHYKNQDITDFGELIQSFPSPVEVSSIIQDMKVPYSESLLLDASKCDNFETSFKKSLGLGVFCADLGYLNVYNKTGDVLNYLVAIRKLTESLKLGQFFDFPTLKRIATNNNNLDSLLILSTMSYDNMNRHLRESNRADVSAMMVTGVWTESLYLASEVYKKKENKRMRDHIASQKQILDKLITALVHYMGNNTDHVKLVSAFKELSKAYEPVVIENFDGEDKTETIDGQSITTQGSYTVITVSDDQMTQIIKAVETLRKKITEAL